MDSGTVVRQPDLHPKYVNSEKLGAKITELCGYLYAGTYRLLVMIREFDEQGYWQLPGLNSCAHWLNFKCGIGMNAAREKVRVARALADLPKISAAFSRGELSYSKVRAMTRVANSDNEDYLLMSDREPIGRRRADALADVAETYLAADNTVAATADRYQVVVHVSAETLKVTPEPAVIARSAATWRPRTATNVATPDDEPHVTAETPPPRPRRPRPPRTRSARFRGNSAPRGLRQRHRQAGRER